MLGCAEGDTDSSIAAALGCHPVTVSKWRHRFSGDRLDGLVDAPRTGAARTISDEKVEAIVVETLENAPPDATHWSTRGLAEKHGISHTTVGEIWRAFGLKLWRQDSFKVSPDPQLIEKIRDIVALYLNPPVAAGVFAVDEKPQIQALVNGEADDASLQRRGEEAGGGASNYLHRVSSSGHRCRA